MAEHGLITAAVYGKVFRYENMKELTCSASQARLAEELSVSAKTIARHLKALVSAGYIEVVKAKRGHSKHYHTTDKVTLYMGVKSKISSTPDFLSKVSGKPWTLSNLLAIRSGEVKSPACVYCGTLGGPQVQDHWIPKTLGGTDAKENLVNSCQPCNSAKLGRTGEEFIALLIERGWLIDDVTESPNTQDGESVTPRTQSPTKKEDSKIEAKREAAPPPLAVRIYSKHLRRYPGKEVWPVIEKTVGTDLRKLVRWARVMRRWAMKGWNKTNVEGMLDAFENGWRDKGSWGGGVRKPQNASQSVQQFYKDSRK